MIKKKSNPDSFSSKVWLMIIDKIVIGAVLAGALFLYNNIKTKETRKYNESREEIQYNFKRAEYVKNLVPIILDEKQQIIYRAHTLRSLLSTRAIDENTAISFAQILLNSDLLSFNERTIPTINMETNKMLSFKPHSDTIEIFFLEIMMDAMPKGLPAAINECEKLKMRAQWFPSNVDEMSDEQFNQDRIIRDSLSFWKRLFIKTLNSYTDTELQVLNHYSLGGLITFYEMLNDADMPEIKKWTNRYLEFPRILAFSKLVKYDKQYLPSANKFFVGMFKSKEGDSRFYEFADFIIIYLSMKDIFGREINDYLKNKLMEISNNSIPNGDILKENIKNQFIKAASGYIRKSEKSSAK
jgi:hypothetical protein